MGRPILVLGHVARDHIGNEVRLGGAAAHGAMAAAALGQDAIVVTAAPAHEPLLAPLENDPKITLYRRICAELTTFELDYSQPVRRIYLRNKAPDLRPADIPAAAARAGLAYIAPVIGECGDVSQSASKIGLTVTAPPRYRIRSARCIAPTPLISIPEASPLARI